MSTEVIKPGVYRHRSGHTITLNKHHPEDAGVPDGYEWIATEEEFAKGEFHPYLLPDLVPADWSPETANHGGGHLPGAARVETVPGLTLDALPDDVKAELVEQVKADLGDVVTKKSADDALQKAVKAANAEADKKIKALEDSLDAKVTAAVEAATK